MHSRFMTIKYVSFSAQSNNMLKILPGSCLAPKLDVYIHRDPSDTLAVERKKQLVSYQRSSVNMLQYKKYDGHIQVYKKYD